MSYLVFLKWLPPPGKDLLFSFLFSVFCVFSVLCLPRLELWLKTVGCRPRGDSCGKINAEAEASTSVTGMGVSFQRVFS